MLQILLALAFAAFADVGTPLESLPIQEAGRIKPFGTFAQETLQLVYGKRAFEKKSATEIVFTWLLIPQHWYEQPLVEIRHKGLKEALAIKDDEKLYSPKSLFENPRLSLIFTEMQSHLARKEKLNPYWQSVSRLENQLSIFQAVRTGQILRFVPNPANDTWKSIPELDGEVRAAFDKVGKGFVDSIAVAAAGATPQATPELEQAVSAFKDIARAQAPDKYADAAKVGWELHLNHFHPFKWAWICYLAGLIALFAYGSFGVKLASPLSWAFLGGGFLLHAYGMALRIYIAGRPPVSNMYETVVWVPWGCVLFGIILALTQKNRFVLACCATVAIFCLILTDLAPTILDASIHPLEPVLRSTFWLTTHVLIITISYAAFFLAFAVGDLMLWYHMRDEKKYAKQIQAGTQSIYRAIQIGVVLLAFGIILGGIWADYSWGRFWGWDPKETWALIALLGYLALLHARLFGLVKNFGLAAGAVVAFSLVIMAWYGVNMVLGAGLHTYGFGAGGVEYVTAFVVAHLLFVSYVSAARYPGIKKPNA